MQLPLIPERDEAYTVIEYPSNRQIQKLIRVHLRNEALSEEAKERLMETYVLEEETSNELGRYEAELEAAKIVFDEEIPEVEPEDISGRAVGEATAVFLGKSTPTNQAGGGLPSQAGLSQMSTLLRQIQRQT